jgi:hypothetical protein
MTPTLAAISEFCARVGREPTYHGMRPRKAVLNLLSYAASSVAPCSHGKQSSLQSRSVLARPQLTGAYMKSRQIRFHWGTRPIHRDN